MEIVLICIAVAFCVYSIWSNHMILTQIRQKEKFIKNERAILEAMRDMLDEAVKTEQFEKGSVAYFINEHKKLKQNTPPYTQLGPFLFRVIPAEQDKTKEAFELLEQSNWQFIISKEN